MKLKISVLIFLLVFSFGLASATFSCDDFSSKWNYCGLMNISGIACDSFWINASDCNLNKTIVQSSNATLNQSDFYSKAEIDSMLGNITQILNASNGTIIVNLPTANNSNFVTQQQLNNATEELWNNAGYKFATNQNLTNLMQGNYVHNNDNSTASTTFDPMWLILAAIIIFGGIYLYKDKNKKVVQQSQFQEFKGTPEDYQKLIDELNKKKNRVLNSSKK